MSDDKVGDIWDFDKPQGILSIEIVEVDDESVRYRTSWEPDTVGLPRELTQPVLKKEWRRWRAKGKRRPPG